MKDQDSVGVAGVEDVEEVEDGDEVVDADVAVGVDEADTLDQGTTEIMGIMPSEIWILLCMLEVLGKR